MNLNEFGEVSDRVNASQGIELIRSTVNLDNPWADEVNMDFFPRDRFYVSRGKMAIAHACYLHMVRLTAIVAIVIGGMAVASRGVVGMITSTTPTAAA